MSRFGQRILAHSAGPALKIQPRRNFLALRQRFADRSFVPRTFCSPVSLRLFFAGCGNYLEIHVAENDEFIRGFLRQLAQSSLRRFHVIYRFEPKECSPAVFL